MLTFDARKGRAGWDCRRICKRGQPDEDRLLMRSQRCGFIPAEEREEAPPVVLGGEEAPLCPAFYYEDPQVAGDVAHLFELESSGMVLDARSPLPYLQAFATIRQARRYAENDLIKAATDEAEAARAAGARGEP